MSKTFDSTQSTALNQSGTGIPPVTQDREEVCPIMPPSEQAAAGSGLLSELQLSLRTECACQPSDQARDREAPYSRHPTSNRPLRTSSRRLWTAVSHHSSLRARSAPARPPYQPGIARLRTRTLNPKALRRPRPFSPTSPSHLRPVSQRDTVYQSNALTQSGTGILPVTSNPNGG